MQDNPNFYPLLLCTLIFLLVVNLLVQNLARAYFSNVLSLTKFPKGTEREEKVKFMAERLIKMCLYFATTAILFYILKQSPYLHTYLWGSNPAPVYFANHPCQPLPRYLDDFYVMKIAYNIFELVKSLIFDTKRRDFPEFFFHHLVTLSLIMFSYTLNFLPAGAVILLIHDLGDVVVSLFKLCADAYGTKITMGTFALVLVYWAYFRLFYFPYFLMRNNYYETMDSPSAMYYCQY